MLYFGPEAMMPLASALAAGAGALLIAGRRTVQISRNGAVRLRNRLIRFRTRFKRRTRAQAPRSHDDESDRSSPLHHP